MTFKPPKPTKAPEPRPDVEVDDHLYVHHAGQPCTGVVKAHGKHGVTVEIDGQHQQVRWDKVLGHKKRAQQRYSVMDHGEDGMLVQDSRGRRRFIAIPNESKEDPMVAKSLHERRSVLLFFKSETPGSKVDNKPGSWSEVDKKAAPIDKGQHVGFENGEHRGYGQVAAAGQHGVTVQDKKGGQHRLLHDQITHRWDGDGEPDQSPHEGAEDIDKLLDGYDGGTPLPPDLVAQLLEQAPPELRERAAEFLREKQAEKEVVERASGVGKEQQEEVAQD